jgi:parallel beta-helix repeat protein
MMTAHRPGGVVMSERSYRVYVLLVLLTLSLSTIYVTTHETFRESRVSRRKQQGISVASYTPHGLITVDGNADFEGQGWPGSGTEDDPYVIEGLRIIDSSTCITISNTDVCFEVRNCFISAPLPTSSDGIVFDNVTHGTVRNCVIELHGYGVRFSSSPNCTVANSILWSNECGVSIDHSSDCTIQNNTINDSEWGGISCWIVRDSIIENNTISDTGGKGISAKFAYNSIYTANMVTNSSGDGFFFHYSNGTFTDNRAVKNLAGFYFLYGSASIMIGNIASDATDHGFLFISHKHLTMTMNSAINNGRTGFLLDADECTLTSNAAISNGETGFLLSGSDCMLTNNSAAENDCGVCLSQHSQDVSLFLNRLYGNTQHNAMDNGTANTWDNGTHGNYWDDYDGENTYLIPGSAESIDNHPYRIDNIPPTVDGPEDIAYEYGTTGHSITWNPEDLNPHSYAVYRNDTVVRTGVWNTSSETITVSIDGLSVGSHTFTLAVRDILGNEGSDMVLVTVVDTTPPTISRPADIEYEYGTTGHTITWVLEDLNPHRYTVYLSGVPVRAGMWNSSSETITISVDGLDAGIHIYTIVVTDAHGNSVCDTVMVTVVDPIVRLQMLSLIVTIVGGTVAVVFGTLTVLHRRKKE